MKIRVKFAKYDALRFIGHLDVMRFFQKALRRAGIDVAYTTGFSPHQIMSFAQPLGIGISSSGEYMDIEVHTCTSEEDMTERLNRACVPGIAVLNMRLLPDTAGNAMASVAAAGYTVRWKEGNSLREKDFSFLKNRISDFLNLEEITVVKETKKGSSPVNIRPGIFQCMVRDEADRPDSVLEFLVDASSSGNIKPSLLLDALWKFAGRTDELPLLELQIHREELYTRSEKDGGLIPMEEAGERF